MIVGTCSLCCGPVIMPDHWYGCNYPVPTCSHCGAVKKEPQYGPFVEMVPAKQAAPTASPTWTYIPLGTSFTSRIDQ